MSQQNITEKGDSDTTNFHERLKSDVPTDLEEILNDALGDFQIQTACTQTGKEVAETDTKSTGTDEDIALLQNKNKSNGIQKKVDFDMGETLDANPTNNITIDYVDKLLTEFQNKMNDFIEDTVNNEPLNLDDGISENNKASTEEIQKKFCKMAQDTMNSLISEGLPQQNYSHVDDDDNNRNISNNNTSNKCTDFKTVISQAIKNLCQNSEELNDGLLMSSSDDIAKLLNDLTFKGADDIDENEIEAHFMKIFIKIGQTVLYPPLKEMCEKYPTYLKNNKLKLSKESYDNYEKQLTNIVQVCKIFEEDVEEGRHHKFQKILTIMEEIQNCGLPPEELVQGNPFQLYDNVVSGIYTQDIKNPPCTIL